MNLKEKYEAEEKESLKRSEENVELANKNFENILIIK